MSGVVATMREALATEVWVRPYMKQTWYSVLESTPIQASGHHASLGAPTEPSRHWSTASRMRAASVNRSPAKARPDISPERHLHEAEVGAPDEHHGQHGHLGPDHLPRLGHATPDRMAPWPDGS